MILYQIICILIHEIRVNLQAEILALKKYLLLIPVIAASWGCSPVLQKIRTFADSAQYHAGFYLYDPATRKVLAEHQADKYFTPASNTKILTLYAAKRVLPDPLPAFYYARDSLAAYLWPTGYPGFLNPVLPDTPNYPLLAAADSLVLSVAGFTAPRFGPGWAWDDYNSSYSPERSAYPIYGNLATFFLDTLSHELTVAPAFLRDSITLAEGEKFTVQRQEGSNRFTVTLGACNDCERQRPYRLTHAMLARLYHDTLHVPVHIDTVARPATARLITGLPQDSVFKVMMQESDNFLAEQLLLQVAGALKDSLDTSLAIDSLQHFLNALLPDSVIWVDGSGLSRYNMITPRSVVMLWDELLRMFGQERLMNILSVGGVAGTIENWYAEEQPYIYGKTGTLRHNHDLSGLLITQSGRLLLFAYMNNHYPSGSTPVKENMEQVLHKIYEKY